MFHWRPKLQYPGLGVALVAAYGPDVGIHLPHIIKVVSFFAGLVMMLWPVFEWVQNWLEKHTPELRRMTLLSLVVLCCVGFEVYGHFSFRTQVVSPGVTSSPQLTELTPRQIFDTDPSGSGGSTEQTLSMTDNRNGAHYSFLSRVIWDSDAGTKYLSVFLSDNTNAYDLGDVVLRNVDAIIKQTELVIAGSIEPGDASRFSSNQFSISRVVYIYMQIDLTNEEQAKLEETAKSLGIMLHFRGLAYFSVVSTSKALEDLKRSSKAP